MGLIMKNGVSYGGGGSSEGGHIIQNGSGTELTQRDTLQFGGYLSATDDSTNSKTVVKDVEEVTWTAWQNMTDEQKAGKHWIITNAPGSMSSDQAIIGIYGQELTFTNLVATIQDERIEANDAVLVYFSNDSVAEAAGIITTWDTGVITFTASTAPSSTLTVNTYIIKPALATPTNAEDVEYSTGVSVKDAMGTLSSLTTTTKTNLVAAINEVNAKTDRDSVSVTGDGVKTYAQLLSELYSLIDYNKISANSYMIEYHSSSYYAFRPTYMSATSTYFICDLLDTSHHTVCFVVGTTGTRYDDTNGNRVDNSSFVATEGRKIEIFY